MRATAAPSISWPVLSPKLELAVAQFRCETVERLRLQIIIAVLTVCPSLPVFPYERTSSDRPGMSGSCQQQTSANVVRLRRLRRCLVWTIIAGADPPGLLTN